VPKVVDHERRREELADAALRLIARDGMRGVTTRAVAIESGWSTGVLSHYFGTLNDLLLAALRRAAEVQGRVFRERRSQSPEDPVEQLRLIVESMLPLDERRVALTRIFAVYYAELGVNHLAREEVVDYLDNFRRMVERIISRGQSDGAIPRGRDATELAVDLVALADGLSVHATIDPRILGRLQSEARPGERVVREVLGLSPHPA
jgi:AcrR family transcriptional regulator